jgi:hypothetical protein
MLGLRLDDCQLSGLKAYIHYHGEQRNRFSAKNKKIKKTFALPWFMKWVFQPGGLQKSLA